MNLPTPNWEAPENKASEPNLTVRRLVGPASASSVNLTAVVPIAPMNPCHYPAYHSDDKGVSESFKQFGPLYARGGFLWSARHFGKTYSPGVVRNAIRLLRLKKNSPTEDIYQSDYGDSTGDFMFPNLAVDAQGSVYMGYIHTSQADSESYYVTSRHFLADSLANPAHLVKRGLADVPVEPPGVTDIRMADFTGAAIDEMASDSSQSTAWMIGEWRTSAGHGMTWLQQLHYQYQPASISGTVYEDCDGVYDATNDMVPRAADTVDVSYRGLLRTRAVTDALGRFHVAGLDAGSYTITLRPRPTPNLTFLNAVPGSGATILSSSSLSVSLASDQVQQGGNVFLVGVPAIVIPTPTFTGVSSDRFSPGQGSIWMSVLGHGFQKTCTIGLVKGTPRPSSVTNDSTMLVQLSAADLQYSGHLDLTVRTSTAGGFKTAAQAQRIYVSSGGVMGGVVRNVATNGAVTSYTMQLVRDGLSIGRDTTNTAGQFGFVELAAGPSYDVKPLGCFCTASSATAGSNGAVVLGPGQIRKSFSGTEYSSGNGFSMTVTNSIQEPPLIIALTPDSLCQAAAAPESLIVTCDVARECTIGRIRGAERATRKLDSQHLSIAVLSGDLQPGENQISLVEYPRGLGVSDPAILRLVECAGGGGQACPYVDVLCDSGWVEGNSILGRSVGGAMLTDSYRIPALAEGDSSYQVRIRENEQEVTSLDMSRLFLVDHLPEVSSWIVNGIALLGTRVPAASIVRSTGEDVTALLASGGAGIVGLPGDTLYASLGVPGAAQRSTARSQGTASVQDVPDNGLVIGGHIKLDAPVISGARPEAIDAAVLSSSGILVQVPDASGSWATVNRFYPRQRPDETVLDSVTAPEVRLIFVGKHALGFVGKFVAAGTALPKVPALLSATHSRLGDVRAGVLGQDANLTVITPGDTVRLNFEKPDRSAGTVRDYFLMSRGVYTAAAPSGSRGPVPPTAVPATFSLGNCRPNPFRHGMSVSFEVPRAGLVRLEIFDIRGRRVRTLADRAYVPGRWTANWDDRTDAGVVAAAGVYFVRMQSGSFVAERRVVALR